jgi:hypothetical protein
MSLNVSTIKDECVQMRGRFCDIQIGYPLLWFMSQNHDAAQFVSHSRGESDWELSWSRKKMLFEGLRVLILGCERACAQFQSNLKVPMSA